MRTMMVQLTTVYQGISMNDSLYERFSKRPRPQPRQVGDTKRRKFSFALKERVVGMIVVAGMVVVLTSVRQSL